jgi:transketolase
MDERALNEVRGLARRIRAHALRMVHRANASHIGTCLSMADILASLYSGILKVDPARPEDPGRDRLIVSKGHGAAALYAVLAERGFFPREWLETYSQDGSVLGGHVTRHGLPGVELSTGSLGHGLPVGCGIALAARRDGRPHRVFVVLSDGEMDEGSNWEAVLFAPQHGLDNLVAIVDCNGLQGFGATREVLDLEPLAEKLRAFRWTVREVDGHDCGELVRVLASGPLEAGRPTALLARTVKGKGVSFMENQLAWHYRAPDRDLLEKALKEIEEGP